MRNEVASWAGVSFLMVALCLTSWAPAASSAESTEASMANVQATESHPAIERRVKEALDGVCEQLSAAKTFSYHADITFDSVLPSFVKLQYSGKMDVTVARPNHLAISYESDLGAKRLWYNGRTLTIFDPPHMVYASVAVPDSIDGMVAQAAQEKNLSIPLRGFDVSNPCVAVYKEVSHSKYVGLNDVGGVDCDHLAFVQEEADWQLWIDHSEKPRPRKIVITYKKLPSQPQWEALFSNWRFDRQLPASMFEPVIPKKAIETVFVKSKEDQP